MDETASSASSVSSTMVASHEDKGCNANTMLHHQAVTRTTHPSFVTQVITIEVDPTLPRAGAWITIPLPVGVLPIIPTNLPIKRLRIAPEHIAARMVHQRGYRRRLVARSGKLDGTDQPSSFRKGGRPPALPPVPPLTINYATDSIRTCVDGKIPSWHMGRREGASASSLGTNRFTFSRLVWMKHLPRHERYPRHKDES